MNIPDPVKYAGIGLALAVGLFGFIAFAQHGESEICKSKEYGDWSDSGMCQIDGNYASNIVIVAGNTANSSKPTISNKMNNTLRKYIANSIAHKANIKVVSAANGFASETLEFDNEDVANANIFIEMIDDSFEKITKSITKSPSADGAAYFEAISQAGRDAASSLNSKNNDSKDDGAVIIVFGSGLSDSGVLNFANNDLLHMNTDSIINELRNTGYLSKTLSGIKVFWSGIGQTTLPQSFLAEPEFHNLKNLYERILLEKGATSVVFDDEIKGSVSVETNGHTVKTVLTDVIVIDETKVAFEPGTARVLDKESAKKALNGVKNKASDKSKTIYIKGYMAPINCTNEYNGLAGERADAIKNLLLSMGVTNQIITENGGVYNPEESICDANGQRVETLAQAKRFVTVEVR